MASASPKTEVGNLSKLPAEIRIFVYQHVLQIQKPVKLVSQTNLAFFNHHISLCAMNYHGMHKGKLLCVNPFDKADYTVHEAPRTVLDLLLTCKKINEEAMPVYFAVNSIIFPDNFHIYEFKRFMSSQRFHSIKNVTLVCDIDTDTGFGTLCSLTQLEVLTIIFPDRGPWFPLRFVPSKKFERLGALRGIKHLRIAGRDRVWTGNGTPTPYEDEIFASGSDDDDRIVDKPGKWRYVDVNHEKAIGPWLRERIMQPKPDSYRMDMHRKRFSDEHWYGYDQDHDM